MFIKNQINCDKSTEYSIIWCSDLYMNCSRRYKIMHQNFNQIIVHIFQWFPFIMCPRFSGKIEHFIWFYIIEFFVKNKCPSCIVSEIFNFFWGIWRLQCARKTYYRCLKRKMLVRKKFFIFCIKHSCSTFLLCTW